MAKTLDAFPASHQTGRQGRYRWEQWFNGEVWHLEQGTPEQVENGERDYFTTTKNFRSAVTQAKKAENKRGRSGHVKTVQVNEDGVEGVVLQWIND